MKRSARIAAAALAAAMAVSSVSITAFAEEDKTMKARLTTVKERIEIPEDHTEFTYRSNKRNNSTYYTFTWNRETGTDENGADYGYSTYNVTIAGNVITNVNIYNEESWDWTPSFAKLSNSKLTEIAKKYIEELNPTVFKYVEIDEDSLAVSLYGNSATLSFKRVKDGIPVENQTGYVEIDKNTGALRSYNFNWILGATFSSADKAISLDKAKTAFKTEFPIELRYTAEYDWEKGEYVPHLIYKQQKYGQIDAFTGKLSTYEDYSYYGEGVDEDVADDEVAIEAATPSMEAGGMNGSAKTVTFTDAEKKKLEDEGKLIKAEKELEDLRKQDIFFIPEGAKVSSDSTNYDDRRGFYVKNVRFTANDVSYTDLGWDGTTVLPVDTEILENGDIVPVSKTITGYFSYNAETGSVMSFNCYCGDIGKDITQKKTAKTAESYLKTLLGDNRAKFGTLTETGVEGTFEKLDENGKEINHRDLVRSFTADRVENGIISDVERVNIAIGNNSKVVSYNLTDLGVEYPKPVKTISKAKAYSEFFAQTEYAMRYRCAYSNKENKVLTALVYSDRNTLYIDAFTGKLTNYNGREITPSTGSNTKEYTDLEGSKYQKAAEKLKAYGITLMDENGKLNENEAITLGDFNSLMSSVGISTYGEEKKETKVTRQLAAKVFVNGKYGKEIAELKGIYKSAFSDVKDDSAYVGYIMIADSLGFIKGIDGKFYPTAKLTRGSALALIYAYLS